MKSFVHFVKLMMIILKLVAMPTAGYGLLPTECDRFSDAPQCGPGEICDMGHDCQPAQPCHNDNDCETADTDYKQCMSGYCQVEHCLFSGSCVLGQKCSNSWDCVYPSIENKLEKDYVILNPLQRSLAELETLQNRKSNITCAERVWVTHVDGTFQTIARINRDKTQWYHKNYCDGLSSCESSTKLDMHELTSTLAISNLNLSDEGDYYYMCNTTDGTEQYQLTRLNVNVFPTELSLRGVRDTSAVGEELELSCTTGRIKPPARAMYCEVNGRRLEWGDQEEGETWAERNQDGQTFTQNHIMKYTVQEEDEGAEFTCVLQPEYGQEIRTSATLNTVKHGPRGQPVVTPSNMSYYENEEVTMECEHAQLDLGHSPCRRYTWYKMEDTYVAFPRSYTHNKLMFIMKEWYQGSYTCRCDNGYGVSKQSDPVKLKFLNSTTAIVPLVENILLVDLPERVMVATLVEATCTITRIKPEALYLYWTVGGSIVNSTVSTVRTALNADETSLTQNVTLTHRFEDEGDVSVACVLVPVRGSNLSVSQTVHVIAAVSSFSTSLQEKSVFYAAGAAAGSVVLLLIAVVMVTCIIIRKQRTAKRSLRGFRQMSQESDVEEAPVLNLVQDSRTVRDSRVERDFPRQSHHHYEDVEEPSGPNQVRDSREERDFTRQSYHHYEDAEVLHQVRDSRPERDSRAGRDFTRRSNHHYYEIPMDILYDSSGGPLHPEQGHHHSNNRSNHLNDPSIDIVHDDAGYLVPRSHVPQVYNNMPRESRDIPPRESRDIPPRESRDSPPLDSGYIPSLDSPPVDDPRYVEGSPLTGLRHKPEGFKHKKRKHRLGRFFYDHRQTEDYVMVEAIPGDAAV